MLVLKKVWEWLKKYWKYILFPVGIVIGLVAMAGRRKVDVIAPELLDAEKKKRQIDQEAREELEKADQKRRREIEEIEQQHTATIQELTDEQQQKLEELRENPDELNNFLLRVGKDIRS